MAAAKSECVKALQRVIKSVEEIVINKKLTRTPRIVAVSKLKPTNLIQELYDAGHRHFGENYVQELRKKALELPKDIEWHFIGHLQTNKCKDILSIPNIALIETVDSEKLAKELNKRLPNNYNVLNIMIQVNTSEEIQKSGISPDKLLSLIEFVITNCPKLKIIGLMTIGKFGDTSPKYFKILAECKKMVCEKFNKHFNENELELSMGMSADYLLATEMGSTNLRIGSTIFGSRPPKQNNDNKGNDNQNNGVNDEKKEDK
eukprot:223479_1